jgi:hypothetical protein
MIIPPITVSIVNPLEEVNESTIPPVDNCPVGAEGATVKDVPLPETLNTWASSPPRTEGDRVSV